MDEWNGWVDGWMDGRMNGWMDGGMDGWMGGWMDGWVGGWMEGWVDEWDGCVDEWDGCVDGWINGWVDEGVNSCQALCWMLAGHREVRPQAGPRGGHCPSHSQQMSPSKTLRGTEKAGDSPRRKRWLRRVLGNTHFLSGPGSCEPTAGASSS